jgi:Mg2+ and Co2+ transporter CorA
MYAIVDAIVDAYVGYVDGIVVEGEALDDLALLFTADSEAMLKRIGNYPILFVKVLFTYRSCKTISHNTNWALVVKKRTRSCSHDQRVSICGYK